MSTGHIRQRSPGAWEIRYRVADKTRTETVRGGKREAQRRLRELLTLADQGRIRRTRIASRSLNG